MRLILVIFFISPFSFSQTNDVVLTAINTPVQKHVYPESYWNVWKKDLPETEKRIANPMTTRRVRKMELFNRFLVYTKMQTIHSEDLLLVFNDAYIYDPHYTAYRYENVFPLNGPEYKYMWNMYKKEKPILDSICHALRSSYNSEFIDSVKLIKQKDQKYRGLLTEKTLDDLKADASWEKQLQLDKENSVLIKSILEDMGYPGRSVVGYEYESVVFLVIQHSNLELMEYGLPFLKKAIENLDLEARYYAYLYDRIQLVKKLPQLYGTQYNLDGSLYSLENPEEVNSRRQKFGLSSIKI